MSLVPVSIRITSGEGEQRIARIRGRFANFQPVMEGPVKAMVRNAIKQQFQTRGGYSGRPWPALSKQTRERKARAGQRRAPLRATDRLYHSLTARNHPDQSIRITRRGFAIRSRVPYGRFHQTGDGVPQREVIPDPMPEHFLRQLRSVVTGYLVTGELA